MSSLAEVLVDISYLKPVIDDKPSYHSIGWTVYYQESDSQVIIGILNLTWLSCTMWNVESFMDSKVPLSSMNCQSLVGIRNCQKKTSRPQDLSKGIEYVNFFVTLSIRGVVQSLLPSMIGFRLLKELDSILLEMIGC